MATYTIARCCPTVLCPGRPPPTLRCCVRPVPRYTHASRCALRPTLASKCLRSLCLHPQNFETVEVDVPALQHFDFFVVRRNDTRPRVEEVYSDALMVQATAKAATLVRELISEHPSEAYLLQYSYE